MPCRLFMLLVVCCALATGLRAASVSSSAKAVARRRPAVTAGAAEPKLHSWTIRGWGKSAEDARQAALEKAQGQVVAYLSQQRPPLQWTPPIPYIDANLVTRQTEEQPEKYLLDQGIEHQYCLDVQVTSQQYQEMRELDRKYLREHRLLLLAKILAALVAVLAALAGYLRLDEATKGYYTVWLRLAAVGFAAAVGVGIWLLPFFKGRFTQ